MSRSNASSGRPAGLIAAAVIVGAEAIGVALIGFGALIASPSGDGVTSGLAVAVFILLIAVLLGVVAVGLVRRRPWSRSPGLVWQIVQIFVGLSALQGDGPQPAFAAAAVVPAIAVLVLLLSRPVREALARAR